MPYAPGCARDDTFDAFAAAGDEGDLRAAVHEFMDEGQSQAGSAAGDGDSKAGEGIGLIVRLVV